MIFSIFFQISAFTIGLKSLLALLNLYKSYCFLKNKNDVSFSNEKNILIVIPALREHSVILKTLSEIKNLSYSNYNVVVATSAIEESPISTNDIQQILTELSSKTSYNVSERYFALPLIEYLTTLSDVSADTIVNLHKNTPTTYDIIKCYLEEHPSTKLHVFKSKRYLPNRAKQINDAISWFTIEKHIPDIIGIYDADSRVDINTLKYVSHEFSAGADCIQQPLDYIIAANDLAAMKSNPIAVANCLYQGSWSLTKELPNLIGYSKFVKSNRRCYERSLYLNGHGMFVSWELFSKIESLPEDVITDGIQLGYRLSLIRANIATIPVFCSDDAPNKVKAIVKQHKRWFAGNVQYLSAFQWAKRLYSRPCYLSFAENIILNFLWAFRSIIIISTLIYFIINANLPHTSLYITIIILSLISYNYICPILAALLNSKKVTVRYQDYLLLPLAAFVKSIGPCLYIADYLLHGKEKSKSRLTKISR